MNDAFRAALEADLASRAFAAPPGASLTPRRVGAEVELIPLEAATGRRCPLESSAAAGGHTDTITSLCATSWGSVPTSSSPSASARARVAGPRQAETHTTRAPAARADAASALPISPGFSTPIMAISFRRARSGRTLPNSRTTG